MFSAGVRRTLNARHFLVGDFGEESVPHTHPYEVELICASRGLDSNGFSTDIAAIEESLEQVLSGIDQVLLNDLDYFRDRQPSLENLAVYLCGELRGALETRNAAPDEPMEIRIWEAPDAWAGYREQTG